MKKYILPTLIVLSALSVSASAAFYSITGLSKLFAGASFEVVIMATSLEVSKLVIATLLHQYWEKITLLLKVYLSIALVVLVCITSMGIYGFLSSAYQETYSKLASTNNKVEFLKQKEALYSKDLDMYNAELQAISENIAKLSTAKATQIQIKDGDTFRNTVSTTEIKLAQERLRIEEQNKAEVRAKRDVASDSLQSTQLKTLELQNNQEGASELGPLQYLSGVTGVPMDRLVNYLLLTIIFVFDPLAISLVIAANFAFDSLKETKTNNQEPIRVVENLPTTEPEPIIIEEPVVELPIVNKIPKPKKKAKKKPSKKVKKEVVVKQKEDSKPRTPKEIVSMIQNKPSSKRVLYNDGTIGELPK